MTPDQVDKLAQLMGNRSISEVLRRPYRHFTPWWEQHNGVIQRARTIDIIVRKDGREYHIEGDFLKIIARALASEVERAE